MAGENNNTSGNTQPGNSNNNNPIPPALLNPGNNNDGGNNPPPAPTSQPPPAPTIDVNTITASARADLVKKLGYSSIDDLEKALRKNAKKTGNDDTDLQKKIEFLEGEEKKKAELIRNMQVNNELMTAISSLDIQLHSVTDFRNTVKSNITTDNDGKVIIIDIAGNPRYNITTGEKLTVSEYLKQELDKKPYFVKNVVYGGAGVNPNNQSNPAGPISAKEVFKTGSFSIQDMNKALGKDKK